MPSPELRCLECNRQFADLTADQEVERCGECGKFVVAAPTLLTAPVPSSPAPAPTADLVADVVAEDVPTVGKAKPPADLPLAQPVRSLAPQPKATLPAWARRDDDAPAPPKPAFPPRPASPSRPRDEAMSNTELPSQTDGKKPRIGLALFVAFLFFIALLAAVGVLGYTIVRGLQMKKVITHAAPVQPLAFSRASDS